MLSQQIFWIRTGIFSLGILKTSSHNKIHTHSTWLHHLNGLHKQNHPTLEGVGLPSMPGVSGNEPGSLAADIAALRSEIATEKGDPDAQRRRMEQRKATV